MFAPKKLLVGSFRPPFSKGGGGLGRGAPNTAFLFCKLFSLCLVPSKRKEALENCKAKKYRIFKITLDTEEKIVYNNIVRVKNV
jgi:hypothetical protein